MKERKQEGGGGGCFMREIGGERDTDLSWKKEIFNEREGGREKKRGTFMTERSGRELEKERHAHICSIVYSLLLIVYSLLCLVYSLLLSKDVSPSDVIPVKLMDIACQYDTFPEHTHIICQYYKYMYLDSVYFEIL